MRRYHNKPLRPKQKPPAKPRFRFDSEFSALIGLIIVLIVVRLGVAVAGPAGIATVGDRLLFGASTVPAPMQSMVLPARVVADPFAAAAESCSLDVNEMSHPGGAMTVMAVRHDGVMMSWAGGATDTKSDCRRVNKQILVSLNDYESLTKTQFPKH
jgi:hypothetical protein